MASYTLDDTITNNTNYTYTIDISGNPNYRSLTSDDLYCALTYYVGYSAGAGTHEWTFNVTGYNSNTGIATIIVYKKGTQMKAGTTFSVFSPG